MDVLFIILGWLLGILSPGIISRISDNYKRKNLYFIIKKELKDVKKRLFLIPFYVYSNYGQLNKDIMKWTIEQDQNLKEIEEIKKFFQSNLESEEKINTFLLNYNNIHKKENPAFHFKEIAINTIESNVLNISTLNSAFLDDLFDLKFQINVINKEMQSVNDYLRMTFDSNISEMNQKIISKEIENKNFTIVKKAVLIVEKINSTVN